jgi:alpha-tubulin suppressor-like RCC1 family protein
MVGCGGSGGGGGGSYTLTINSTAGGVVAVNNVTIPGTAMFTYDVGTVVSLNATPHAGYRFVNWTGNDTVANVTAANTTITMNGDYSITANFVAVYNLTIASTAGGTVTTPGVGTFIYDAGTVVSLNATPDASHRFVDWTGNGTIANVTAANTTITMSGNYSITANFEYIPMIAAGWFHTVGVKSDGTAVAVGYNYYGQCNVGGWTNITQVAAEWHTVGLMADGTVVAVGYNDYGQCDVGGWGNITQIAAGYAHTVGLKDDGTVVAVGGNGYLQCDVDDWTDIIQVTSSYSHTVGLKNDGTVVAVGGNGYLQCDVGGWDLG